jgi:hypothetical protein
MIRVIDVGIATLWWEESKAIEKNLANRNERLDRLFMSCLHSDDERCEALHVLTLLATIEIPRPPLLYSAITNETNAKLIIDEILFEAVVRGDPDLAFNTLLSLPRDFRISYLEELSETKKTWLNKLLGDEVIELLKKSRVELKIVLDLEDVLPMVRKHGQKWREEARQLLIKALEQEFPIRARASKT